MLGECVCAATATSESEKARERESERARERESARARERESEGARERSLARERESERVRERNVDSKGAHFQTQTWVRRAHQLLRAVLLLPTYSCCHRRSKFLRDVREGAAITIGANAAAAVVVSAALRAVRSERSATMPAGAAPAAGASAAAATGGQ